MSSWIPQFQPEPMEVNHPDLLELTVQPGHISHLTTVERLQDEGGK